MKRILVLFLALLLALFVPCLAEEEEKITEKPEIDSRYGIVYNVDLWEEKLLYLAKEEGNVPADPAWIRAYMERHHQF